MPWWLAVSRDGFWVDLRDARSVNEWTWGDGRRLDIESDLWAAGQPSKEGRKDCAVYSSGGGLANQECTIDKYIRVLCQYKVRYP